MPGSSTLRCLLAVFAAYRLASLWSSDEGPYVPFLSLKDKRQTGVFESIRVKAGVYDYGPDGKPETNFARGLSCPLCTGVYMAALVTLLVLFPFRLGTAFLVWMGIAGAQVFLENLTSDEALQGAIENVADSLEE